jgi:hypothetical protein
VIFVQYRQLEAGLRQLVAARVQLVLADRLRFEQFEAARHIVLSEFQLCFRDGDRLQTPLIFFLGSSSQRRAELDNRKRGYHKAR